MPRGRGRQGLLRVIGVVGSSKGIRLPAYPFMKVVLTSSEGWTFTRCEGIDQPRKAASPNLRPPPATNTRLKSNANLTRRRQPFGIRHAVRARALHEW